MRGIEKNNFVWINALDSLNIITTSYGNSVYLTIELHDLEDIKFILLKVALCFILIFLFCMNVLCYYVGGDKSEQNENIRCSDITAFCCQCAK